MKSASKNQKKTIWEKIKTNDNLNWDLDELKTAIHWFRQFTSLTIGIIFGILPFTGLYAFITFLSISILSTVIFYTSVIQVDPDEFGGHGALSQEGLAPALSMFLLAWIVSYSLVQF